MTVDTRLPCLPLRFHLKQTLFPLFHFGAFITQIPFVHLIRSKGKKGGENEMTSESQGTKVSGVENGFEGRRQRMSLLLVLTNSSLQRQSREKREESLCLTKRGNLMDILKHITLVSSKIYSKWTSKAISHHSHLVLHKHLP